MASHSKQSFSKTAPELSNCSLRAIDSDSSAALVQTARELLLEYGRFVAAQPTVASFCYGDLEKEAAELPHSYLSQNGGTIVAFRSREAIGFIAWRTLPAPELASEWEIKRLWIRPQARGIGLGRILVQEVIRRALDAGKSRLLLDTEPNSMAAAHRLYIEMGFSECPSYNGPAKPGIVYMHKELETL
jgi:putative acetyltransferase